MKLTTNVQQALRSLESQLDTQLVSWLQKGCDIDRHTRSIASLMLMKDGLCLDFFLRDFLRALHSPLRVRLIVPGFLTDTIRLAMIEGGTWSNDAIRRFRYDVSERAQTGKCHVA